MDLPLRTLSLCSGIGGLDMGVAQAIPIRPMGYVEREAFSASILLARMEDQTLEPAPVFIGNLQDLDATPLQGHIDLITAGIPCQPWSQAGKQSGQDDERHLGDELLRIVREVRPQFVFVENVAGFVQPQGIGHIAGSLAQLGFDAEWTTLRAADVGAPHLRKRLFFLGHTHLEGLQGRSQPLLQSTHQLPPWPPSPQGDWDSIPRQLHPALPESQLRRMAHGPSTRVDRLRALGNSVVPQQAAAAFTTLLSRALQCRKLTPKRLAAHLPDLQSNL